MFTSLLYIHFGITTHCSRAAPHWQVADLPGKRVVVLFGEVRGPPSGPARSVTLWLWEGTVSREALAG